MTSRRHPIVTMLSALVSAALLFLACHELEITGEVTPLGPNETFTISDTAIVYTFHNDSTNATLTFHMDDGIVHTSSAKLVFDNAEGALAYYNAYASDFGISDMQLDGLVVNLRTSTYDKLTQGTILDIIQQRFLYSNDVGWPTVEKSFTAKAFDELKDGMRIILAQSKSRNDNYIFSNPSLICTPSSSLQPVHSEYAAWRLRQQPTGWVIELGDSTYLRRCGHTVLPIILTGCDDIGDATLWQIDNSFGSIVQANYWTIHSRLSGASDFYGLTIGASGELQATADAAEIFTFLNASVALKFEVRDSLVQTNYAIWGTDYVLPYYQSTDPAYLFIGWNTDANKLDGYLPPGSHVEAEDITYHAIFAKAE